MNREPLSLYLFRFITGLGLFAFMAMLYWSSVLVEEDLKKVQRELKHIKIEIDELKEGIEKNGGIAKNSFHELSSPLNLSSDDQGQQVGENLLKPDLFYEKTLPRMLGAGFKPHGTRREATIGKPANLHPFSNWSEIASWISLCSVSLGGLEVGKYEALTPDMALSMELRHSPEGKPEYWMSLRQDVFWQPLNPSHFPSSIQLAPMFLKKQQVTAHDFKFYFDAIMNPHVEEPGAVALRNYLNDIEELEAVDDFTLIVRWKSKEEEDKEGNKTFEIKYLAKSYTAALRPLPRFVYQYFSDGTKIVPDDTAPNTYRTNPVWALNFSHHWANHIIVSCGPWQFDGLTDREIRFKRNPNFYQPYANLTERYEVKFRDSPDSIWDDFKAGSLDLFNLPPNLLSEFDNFIQSSPYQRQATRGLEVKRLDYLMRSYNYIGWNQANPLFKSRLVRQALTYAIDRERIIRQTLNGMAIQTTGTFFPYSPSYDSSLKPYPFDPDQAKELLEEEGWFDNNGDGILDKVVDGKEIPFRFTLTYYVKNPSSKAVCDYVSTALRKIGIDCIPNGVDLADLSATFEDKSFDAVFLGWSLGSPPEDPKQLWHSSGAKVKGSSNAVGFSNPEADKIIEQLEYEDDPKKRIELYHRFDAILYEEAPYTFLYVPKIALVYRNYMQNIFIPADRQDLIPGANVGEPQPSIFWIK